MSSISSSEEALSIPDALAPLGDFVPVSSCDVSEVEKKLVLECLETAMLSGTGNMVSRFEEKFCERFGYLHAVAVSNGTVALSLSLMALDLPPGSEVIVPAFTFAATVSAVVTASLRPVFVDCDSFGVMSVAAMERAIGPRTKVVIPVHVYGNICDMDAISQICERRDVLIIEDCAEALGEKCGDRYVGTSGAMATFSFFANKSISTGEGGMVISENADTASKLRHLRSNGMVPDRKYWHNMVGLNARMPNMSAAVGLGQLLRLDSLLNQRLAVIEAYGNALDGWRGLRVNPRPPHDESTKKGIWMACLWLPAPLVASTVANELARLNIDTRPFFQPLHTMPPYEMYARFGLCGEAKSLPNTEILGRSGLLMPTSSTLSLKLVGDICDRVKMVVCNHLNVACPCENAA